MHERNHPNTVRHEPIQKLRAHFVAEICFRRVFVQVVELERVFDKIIQLGYTYAPKTTTNTSSKGQTFSQSCGKACAEQAMAERNENRARDDFKRNVAEMPRPRTSCTINKLVSAVANHRRTRRPVGQRFFLPTWAIQAVWALTQALTRFFHLLILEIKPALRKPSHGQNASV